jgi:hypothetical protein
MSGTKRKGGRVLEAVPASIKNAQSCAPGDGPGKKVGADAKWGHAAESRVPSGPGLETAREFPSEA